jgi:4-hydroxybenzoyl-CoA thioesterase
MASFQLRLDIMFQHCDPAGIVFYPRYFEMMNNVTEIFFRDVVGWPFSQMHATDRRGIPAVSAKLDFKSPARLGDQLDWSLQVARLGKSSVTFDYHAFAGPREVLAGQAAIVHTDLDAMKSLQWTPEIRAVLVDYVNETPDD